jgi:hypothetical protein
MTETKPIDDRRVIRISVPVHEWLRAEQEKLGSELNRRVTFTEIIADLIVLAETGAAP